MAVNIDHDNTYTKMSAANFSSSTTLQEAGLDETVLVIDETGATFGSIGDMRVAEWFNGSWYWSTAIYSGGAV